MSQSYKKVSKGQQKKFSKFMFEECYNIDEDYSLDFNLPVTKPSNLDYYYNNNHFYENDYEEEQDFASELSLEEYGIGDQRFRSFNNNRTSH